ncbi:MAG: hypothetical protein ACLFUW_08005 [Bacteroidales bacterium]
MKKLIVLLLVVFFGVNLQSFSQAVDDRAVVPVSVTLNSILRLNVESGGNIEFNFNTLEQYESGISGIGENDQYSTKLTIASSVNWDLVMGAEDDGLVSTDDTTTEAGVMDLGYITYEVAYTGSDLDVGTTGDVDIPSSGNATELLQLTDDMDPIIEAVGNNAGDVNKNEFRVDWACGSTDDNAIGRLLGSDLTGGRYSTNVFFILQPTGN